VTDALYPVLVWAAFGIMGLLALIVWVYRE